MATISETEDAGPVTWCLKVLPIATPNGVGTWRKFVVEHRHRSPQKYPESGRATMWDMLDALVCSRYPGHHCVAVQTDLRYTDKPGDWSPKP